MNVLCSICSISFTGELDWIQCDACENLVHFREPCVEFLSVERDDRLHAHILCRDCCESEDCQ